MSGGTTGLVLAGGGARGSYEAGALSVILPELERRGERPTIFAGASVGAINAAVLASLHDLSAEEATAEMLALWRRTRLSDVIRPIIRAQGPMTLLRLAGQLLPIGSSSVKSLLDPAPLWRNVDEWVHWDALHSGVAAGAVDCLAVVATSARTGRTVVFYERGEERNLHRSHAVAYVPTPLSLEHVRASGALPIIWPPVEVLTPARARGWYFDGGTRLNAPIKPVLDLGAERLVVMAVDSIAGPVMEPDEGPADTPPDFGDGILHLLEGTLVDPLIEDMQKLGNVNAFLADAPDTGATLYRTVRGKAPYKRVPYIFVGPETHGMIGRLAAEMFRERYGGMKAVRSPDLSLVNALLGGDSPSHGELLSLLFFDGDFIDELIRLGRLHARAWLDADHDGDGPWQIGPLSAFVRPRQWTAG